MRIRLVLSLLCSNSLLTQVLAAANDCDVGLASYIMTSGLNRSHRLSEALQVGMVAINTGAVSEASSP